MSDPTLAGVRRPLSLVHMTRIVGSDRLRLAALIPNMIWDYYFLRDDFEASTMVAALWSTAVTAGGVPTAFAYNAQRNGAIRGAAGTTDNGAISVYGNAIYDAADNPGLLVRWKAPAAVTGFSFEIGFSDPLTDEALPAVDDVDTPSTANGATDVVVVHMDTDQTLTTAALVTDGTTDAAAKTDIGTWTPTASKWIDTLIQVRANKGECHNWDNGVYQGGYVVNSGPDTGVLMRPHFLFRTRNTTTKQIDIDYVVIWAERNAT